MPFRNTVGQAAASRWLQLPQLVHGKALGDYVASWNDHSLADHDEAITVLLPPKLLHVFCWLQALYFHKKTAYLNAAAIACGSINVNLVSPYSCP